MANKGIEAFDAFTAGVLSKITDPEQRQRAETAIASLKTLEPVAQAFGDGVAGQSEIDRRLQELTDQTQQLDARRGELDERETALQTWRDELTGWFNERKDQLKEYEQMKAGHRPTQPTSPAATTTTQQTAAAAGMTPEQLAETLQNERLSFLGFQRDLNLITRTHFEKFKEVPEVEPLLKHPQIGQLGLIGVYELVNKDRLAAWNTEQQTAHDRQVAENAVREFREKQTQMPYPTPTGVGSGSPLDALDSQNAPVVDAAVAHYQRLQAERAGGTSA